MRYAITPEQQTLGFVASSPASIKIGARSSWIVGFLLELEIAKTESGSPTTYQDYLYRAITNLTIASGQRTYVNVGNPDTRILYWANRGRTGGRAVRVPDMVAGSNTIVHQLRLLFTPNPVNADGSANEFDAIAGIKPEEALTLSITWGAALSMGALRTIGAGALVRVSYIEAIPETDAEIPQWYPHWVSGQYTPQQVYADFGGSIALENGWMYRRAHFLNLLGAAPNDLRNDGKAGTSSSAISIKTSDGRNPMQFKWWDFSQKSQSGFLVADDNTGITGGGTTYGVSSTAVAHNPGYGMIDLAKGGDPARVDPMFGTNLIKDRNGNPVPANAFRFGITAEVTTNVSLVYLTEAYGRY